MKFLITSRQVGRIFAIALGASILVLAVGPAARSAAQQDTGPPRWSANLQRKQQVILQGLPAAYSTIRDPLPDNTTKIRRGGMLFDQHCSACHGWSGHGSGPAAFALVPAPADLAWLSGPPKEKAKPYIYWATAEGGGEFQSDMPAFKAVLPPDDIWAIISYVSAGMPRASP